MKKMTCIALVGLLAVSAYGQSPSLAKLFTLKGHLTGKPVDSIFVDYVAYGGKYTHTAEAVKNGEFSIVGGIAQPVSARILFKTSGEIIPRAKIESRTRSIYIDPVAQTISGDPADLKAMKVTGSPTQTEYEELEAKILPIRAEMQPFVDEYMAEKNHEKQAAIRDKFEPFQDRIKKVTYAFLSLIPTHTSLPIRSNIMFRV